MRLIYGLYHPDTDILFYIGQSRRGLARPRCHWNPTYLKNDSNKKKAKVIRGILADGKEPVVRVLATASTDDELNHLEIELIAKFRKQISTLTNIAAGGDAPSLDVCSRGGQAAAALGICVNNNLKLRKPIIATNLTTGEERWYLSSCHAAADGLGSRSAISNCLRPNWRCRHNRGWTYRYVGA